MTGDYLTITDAARALGVSTCTIRRRIKSGVLQSELLKAKAGPTWYVWIPSDVLRVADAEPETVSVPRGLSDLVLLVDRLQRENQELATRVGYLESELQHARS
jgi:hypothetical protein